MYAKVDDVKQTALIKRSEHDDEALEITFRRFFQFLEIPQNKKCTKRTTPPHSSCLDAEDLCNTARKHDYTFANLGHHEIWKDTIVGPNQNIVTFQEKVHTIFERTSACGLANNSHFSWIGHPPSHFAKSNNRDGGFIPGQENHASKCSCNLPNLEQQPNIRNSRIAKEAAETYGFRYISVWEDFKDNCDAHPVDCQHYIISPSVWASMIRKINVVIDS